ncbi:MAG: GNAT family N-acetyltransferase [Alphaproteobacteria bacterium]|nr:GNAT family N-acetyltransferase [Alphaproteobacteria bacterium]
MPNFRIEFEPHNAAAREFVVNGLDNFNIARTGLPAYYPVAFFLKAQDGEVAGGITGLVWGEWLHISYLWVADPLRRRGYGSRLLESAETYARSKGCRGVYLETFSFQARPLYESRGYRVCGQIKDFPPGEAFYFLEKRLGTSKTKFLRKARSKGNARRRKG